MNMKRLLPAALLLLLALPGLAAGGVEKSLLFVGNSHIFSNNFPTLFHDLAYAGGHDVYVDQSTVGGATLSYHSGYQPTLDLIQERDWTYVVMQEHSLFPVIDHWRDTSFFPKATLLDSIITASGSNTAFMMTWGREDAAGPYCVQSYCSREFDDFFDMQSDISAAYESIAAELGAMVAPVGRAWANALSENSSLPLWSYDGYHPSLEGSYLAACVFYVRVFHESPQDLPFYGGLFPPDAMFYQRIASQLTGVDEPSPPSSARLLPSHPNPFNPSTQIRFELDEPARVSVAILDSSGRYVRSLDPGSLLSSGEHAIEWNGRDDSGVDLPSGIYLLSLDTGNERHGGKLTLMK
jgi:hypothetical protein